MLRLLLAAIPSGMANALILKFVNDGVRSAGAVSLYVFVAFLLTCALYAVSYYAFLRMLSRVFEDALYALRLRMADKIQRAELRGLEQIGAAEIYERVTRETSVISQAAASIASGVHSAVLVAFLMLYVALRSTEALVLMLIVYGGGALVYSLRSRRIEGVVQGTEQTQVRLFERLTDMLDGMKETRLRRQRAQALRDDFASEAGALRESTVQANLLYQSNVVFANLNLFTVMAAVVFVLPQFFPEFPQVLGSLVAAILFMFEGVGGVVLALPHYERASAAARSIFELEQKLEASSASQVGEGVDPFGGRFRELRAVGLKYTYPSAASRDGFSIGPVDLTLRAGETVFFIGGNGSGKSTLVKVLTGLYAPTDGVILVDGHRIEPHNVQAYRELFAAIFSDFHLFRKLYGLAGLREDAIDRLLAQMQLERKTGIVDNAVSNLELSTGQRKRLAMVVALLEDRPIYVLDEWAAEQDPEFRRYFYETLLVELKQRGKTVIAITHDDRYFHCADRILTMEEGRLAEKRVPTGLS